MLIPYIALIIAIILTLTSLSILNYSGLHVAYVYSVSLIAYTGEAIGYTNDIPLASTPFNKLGIVNNVDIQLIRQPL